MAKDWTVLPGVGAAGGIGSVAGTVTHFEITRSDESKMSAIFAGVGLSFGGPASVTFSDKETPGYPGKMIWALGRQPNDIWLRNPPNGLIISVGTAPRHLLTYFGFPQDPMKIAGAYVCLLAFGVTSETAAVLSISADVQFKANGKLLTGACAYAAAASLAKGFDIGGAAVMPGSWFIY